eukprot:COSAG02_NODE_298_length_25350_cov_48.266999_8_plen_85_part_00
MRELGSSTNNLSSRSIACSLVSSTESAYSKADTRDRSAMRRNLPGVEMYSGQQEVKMQAYSGGFKVFTQTPISHVLRLEHLIPR